MLHLMQARRTGAGKVWVLGTTAQQEKARESVPPSRRAKEKRKNCQTGQDSATRSRLGFLLLLSVVANRARFWERNEEGKGNENENGNESEDRNLLLQTR